MKIPKEVADWVEDHKGKKFAIHAEGSFDEYNQSKLACCWGNNGIETDNYFIAVCLPSPMVPNGVADFFFDFKPKN